MLKEILCSLFTSGGSSMRVEEDRDEDDLLLDFLLEEFADSPEERFGLAAAALLLVLPTLLSF
jgi:hypothetical protein